MIDQVTESLEAFLKQPGLPPPLKDAQIRFDRPTDPYSLEQTTVNLFLYEVRENVELRSNEPVVRRVLGDSIVEPPPYRLSCIYLVTAWPIGGQDLPKQEQRLLSQVLQLFAGAPHLPAAFLTAPLQTQEPDLPIVMIQPEGVRNPAEFWAAIGNRIKPSILLSVTVSLSTFDPVSFPTVITSELRWRSLPGNSAIDSPFFRIAGTVVDVADAPVPNASVRVVERGRSTLTDEEGRFSISAIPSGNFTLSITAGAQTKTRPITVPAPAVDDYDVKLP